MKAVTGRMRFGFLAAVLFCVIYAVVCLPAFAADKAVSATISSETVKVGKTVHITAKTKGVTYVSSNREIAYVSEDGTVSGKKPGTVTIHVQKKGYAKKSFKLTVKKNKKLPDVRVACDEIAVSEELHEGGLTVSVKNRASKKADKIVAYYEITTGKKHTVAFTLENVKAGKSKQTTDTAYTLE
ncbi:MAG: Ig-like domain-containing protein, partial [Lachnospiraceae bacterium]|nr:Ig-like domain-containing protein [Lachnospiraceae bacterium]